MKHQINPPPLRLEKSEISEWLTRQLTQIWIEFETSLLQVPIVKKILDENLKLEDYLLLLLDMRYQVIDGSQWISRAASNIDMELFELRSAFIGHAATEHRDYQLLEKNYISAGGDPKLLKGGLKNMGSQALSDFMFQRASQSNPVDLLGSMFIIEGVGNRLAAPWGLLIKSQLGLKDDQVSFFKYHGQADEHHFAILEKALNHPALNIEIAQRIARTAKMTAWLYTLQFDQLGQY